MNLETERLAAKALSKPGHVQGAITFNKVGLRYKKDGDPIFVGLNFSLKPGEMLAIAGGNGTGKSTILKLAMGLYRPQAGAITLDGRDIRQIDPMALRHEFAYVPQIPELYDGTLAENVRLGNPNASDADIRRALDIVDMDQETASLPQGLETRIRTGGEALPASLAYRIALARAYVRDTAVMLFDELPPAVLNSETGRRFIERVRSWHGGKTILLVTHRNDLVRMAHRAVGFLNNGRIIVDTPEQVIQKLRDETLVLNGRFS